MTEFDQIARAALEQYDLPTHTPEFISNAENVTYRVRLDMTYEQPDTAQAHHPHKLLLRIHRPQGHVRAMLWNPPHIIKSELRWLEYLARETDLAVPFPVKTTTGEEIAMVQLEDYEQSCTLMRWVRGKNPNIPPDKNTSFLAGAAAAEIHCASIAWIGDDAAGALSDPSTAQVRSFELYGKRADLRVLSLSTGIVRPMFDVAMLIDWQKIAIARARTLAMPEPMAQQLETALDHAAEILNRQPPTPQTFGLIHGDFYPTNYVIYEEQCRPIDFSSCGFGWFMQDVGYALVALKENTYQTFLEGYRSVRPTAPLDTELIRAFLVIGRVITVLELWPKESPYTPFEKLEELLTFKQ